MGGGQPAAALIRDAEVGRNHQSGRWVQVSRLGNPLFNEVIVPLGDKDRWNSLPASQDSQFAKYVQHPELAGLLPVLYPGCSRTWRSSTGAAGRPGGDPAHRDPVGVVPGLPELHRGRQADQLRLNMAIAPAAKPNPSA